LVLFTITVETDNEDWGIQDLARKGMQFIGEPIQHTSGKVGFVHPKSLYGAQLELFQPKSG